VTVSQLYFDDFSPGQTYVGQSRTLGEEEFRKFAELTGDSHPIHYDREYAMKTRFGERVAHGLLVMSVTALGATALSKRLESSMVALVGQDCRFLRPVMIGETVSTEFEVVEVRNVSSEVHGLVRFQVRVRTITGDVALIGHHMYLIRRREV
jgi:3-hydroxybutyryl-CoA dehydratase